MCVSWKTNFPPANCFFVIQSHWNKQMGSTFCHLGRWQGVGSGDCCILSKLEATFPCHFLQHKEENSLSGGSPGHRQALWLGRSRWRGRKRWDTAEPCPLKAAGRKGMRRLDRVEQAQRDLHREHRLRPSCCCQTSWWPCTGFVHLRAAEGIGSVCGPQSTPLSKNTEHKEHGSMEGKTDTLVLSKQPHCFSQKFRTEDAQLFQVCKEPAVDESATTPHPFLFPSIPWPLGHACCWLCHRRAGELIRGEAQSQWVWLLIPKILKEGEIKMMATVTSATHFRGKC